MKFEVGFIYESNLLDDLKLEHFDIDSAQLKSSLDLLETQFGLTSVKISKTTYVLRRVNEKPNGVHVYGQVTEEYSALGLPGVYVREHGTEYGAVTDLEGNYRLKISDPKSTILVFSFVGYAQKRVLLKGRSEININLFSKETELSEVLITAVGIDKNKRELGYSIQNVSTEELKNAREAGIVQFQDTDRSGTSR